MIPGKDDLRGFVSSRLCLTMFASEEQSDALGLQIWFIFQGENLGFDVLQTSLGVICPPEEAGQDYISAVELIIEFSGVYSISARAGI